VNAARKIFATRRLRTCENRHLCYTAIMTKRDVKSVLDRVLTWSEKDQEELAEVAREIEARRTGVYHAMPEELEAIDHGLRASAEGRIATEEEVEAAFRKFRRA
jgi:hypothetical protein